MTDEEAVMAQIDDDHRTDILAWADLREEAGDACAAAGLRWLAEHEKRPLIFPRGPDRGRESHAGGDCKKMWTWHCGDAGRCEEKYGRLPFEAGKHAAVNAVAFVTRSEALLAAARAVYAAGLTAQPGDEGGRK